MQSLTIHPILVHDLYNEVRKSIAEGQTPKAITLTEVNGQIAFSFL